VSRKSSRPDILKACRELIEERRGSPVTVTEVAERAGVSRQAIYLHFADLSEMLLELSREADSVTRTAALQATIDDAPTARQALHNAVAVQAHIKPRLHALITALDVMRRSDPAAQAVYEERDNARYQRVVAVVERLQREGELADDWDVESGARLAWAMMSQRVWEDLDCHDEDTYTTELFRFLENALCRRAG
jgi:AcrR family transcriptional regulator